MLKGQRIRALILLGTMLGPPILSTRALPRPNRQPKVWMGIAGTATMPDGALVALRGFLFEADFFEKLEPKKTADGIILQRGGKIVEFFPGEMQCKLLVTGLPRFDDKIHRRIDPNLNAESLSALRFSGFWKNGLKMRPVESLSLLTMSVEEQKLAPFLLLPGLWPSVTETLEVWVFEFRVRAQAVPVTDHFILTMETPTRERLARLSARLRN